MAKISIIFTRNNDSQPSTYDNTITCANVFTGWKTVVDANASVIIVCKWVDYAIFHFGIDT